MLTRERLSDLLSYDASTGEFRWRRKTNNAQKSLVAGTKTGGYVQIQIDGHLWKAHRLAWLWVYGELPSYGLDHINGNGADNRIENLRDVSQSVNRQNQRRAHSDNKAGLLGVCWDGSRFIAQIKPSGGRNTCIGRFDTPEEAHAAYVSAKRILHEGCTL